MANQKLIHERTGISPRTIKYAIKLLKDEGFIAERSNRRDMRAKSYCIKEGRWN